MAPLPDFSPTDWKDSPSTATPLSSANLKAAEARIAARADEVGAEAKATAHSELVQHEADGVGVHGIVDASLLVYQADVEALRLDALAHADAGVEAVTEIANAAQALATGALKPTGNPADAGKTFDAQTGALVSVGSGVSLSDIFPFVVEDPANPGAYVRLTPSTVGIDASGNVYANASGPAAGESAYPSINPSSGSALLIPTGA